MSDSDTIDEFDTLESLSPEMYAKVMEALSKPGSIIDNENSLSIESTPENENPTESLSEGPWFNTEPVSIDSAGKNGRKVICPFCKKSIVLLAHVANFVEMEAFMAFPNASKSSDGKIYSKFFKVTNKMQFENVEVKRPIGSDNFRYLSCGDCGIGPIGVTFDADRNGIFYVSHDRIMYR